MIHPEQLKIIQNLMIKYKETKEEYLFEQLLDRIDDRLIGMVYKIAKLYYFNSPNIQDLYQCAIIGVYKAIDSITPMDDSNYIMRRIYVYARKEVFQEYKEKKMVELDVLMDLVDLPELAEYAPPDAGLIKEERIAFFRKLLSKKIITQEDLNLLILRYVDNRSIRSIVKEKSTWGKTRSTVTKRIDNILKVIRKYSDEENLHIL